MGRLLLYPKIRPDDKNFHEDPISVFRDMSQIVENALSRNIEEFFTKILDPNPEADDFQNLINSFLTKDTSQIRSYVLSSFT